MKLEGYALLHEGVKALSEVEANGMRVDVDYLKRTIDKTDARIKKLQRKLKRTKFFKRWSDRFGPKTNLGSREQLGTVLFEVMGFECSERTASGRPKTDEHILEGLNHPFVKHYLKLEKLKKLNSTYLNGIAKEVTEQGFIHPVFNLHIARTFRSSSDSPNFQNMPIRVPWMGKIIRQCFIPREGNRLVEIDYSGIEVRIAACYNKDPVLIEYIEDPTKDMHRDMAAECFICKPEEVTKQMRYCGKNMFVFPEFYGSFYPLCAKSLWEAIERLDLEIGVIPLRGWLEDKGIVELGRCDPSYPSVPGTFEHHIKEVETRFWGERFVVYSEWKRKWWNRYVKHHRFRTLTGFEISGHYRRNDVINYPIQGSAFHCLLWSLIHICREIRRRKMKTKVVGQIHDSIVADVPEHEMEEYISLAKTIMTKRIRKHWPWIIVPLEVEVEATPINGSWFEKKVWEA